jgi:hypothetical protein
MGLPDSSVSRSAPCARHSPRSGRRPSAGPPPAPCRTGALHRPSSKAARAAAIASSVSASLAALGRPAHHHPVRGRDAVGQPAPSRHARRSGGGPHARRRTAPDCGDQGHLGHLMSPGTLVCAWRGRRRRLRPVGARGDRGLPSASTIAALSSPRPAWIIALAISTARGERSQTFAAIASATARGRRHLGRKAQRERRSAPIRRPNSAISLTTLPAAAGQPLRARPARHDADPASGSASVAFGAITRMSQAAASSSPPPKAWPFSAAMVGLAAAPAGRRSDARRAPSAGELGRGQVAPGVDVGSRAEGLRLRRVTRTQATSAAPLDHLQMAGKLRPASRP